jgi:hypothetical protein
VNQNGCIKEAFLLRIVKYGMYFGFLAGMGILLGCWIHGIRTNQPMIMSGVAFVRELPQGELTVGRIETWWFGRKEIADLDDYRKKNPNIQIDPAVAKAQQEMLYSNKPK